MPHPNRKPSPDRRRAGRGRPRPPRQERLSRLLAFILRHHPDQFGLELDERASAALDDVAAAVRGQPGLADVTRQDIERLVTGEQSQRFEIEGDRLRARYGHSFEQPIRLEPADPPPDLFHGTTPEAAETCLLEGLKPSGRQFVHLSGETPAAREVGRRRCPVPAVLRVDTASARKAGVRFYPGGASVWLSDPIPPECITRVE
jgi:putative RNA 2'-phosphotransferase